MNDQKNTILAIVLSALVLIAWQYFFGLPQFEKQRQAQQQQQAPRHRPVAVAPAPAKPKRRRRRRKGKAPAPGETAAATPVAEATSETAAESSEPSDLNVTAAVAEPAPDHARIEQTETEPAPLREVQPQ